MCGILGIVERVPSNGRALRRVQHTLELIRHRGPDDCGTVDRGAAVLGACRLAIIDPAAGHQPMSNGPGTIWAVQNGELYNHEQLRAELERDGCVFRTHCDTEILPHLYERYGPAFAERLEGKFAVAIWDEGEQRLTLARDRLGVKPLYYADDGDELAFGSEIKAVLALRTRPPAIDPVSVAAVLALGFVPAPTTLLRDVTALPPGHVLVRDHTGTRVTPYWRYPDPEPVELPAGEHEARLLTELRAATRRRLMADVPVAALLSGGLDSSLVVALMAEEPGRVTTYAVGFRDDDASELADARAVAKHFDTDHHEITLDHSSGPALSDVVWHLDQPVADASVFGMKLMSAVTAADYKVALSGQGADELFGGYRKHVVANALTATRSRRSLRRWIPRMPRPESVRRLTGMAHAGTALAAASAASAICTRHELDAVLNPSSTARHLQRMTEVESRIHAGPFERLGDLLFVDAQLALPDLMLNYFDRMSMAESLEVRVPFLDHHVVETAATIPDGLKVDGAQTKVVLRNAARGFVPDFVIDKPKTGFLRRATASWVEHHAPAELRSAILHGSPRLREHVDIHALRRLLRRSHHVADGRLMLGALMLESWLTDYLPRIERFRSELAR